MILVNKLSASLVIIPEALINDAVISDKAKILYCKLAARGEAKNVSKEKTAESCGYSLATYKKYEDELAFRGWIEIAPRKGKEQERFTLNSYVKPIEAPKIDNTKANFKPLDTHVKDYIEIYHKFYVQKTGVKPLIAGAEVNAIKNIAYYFEEIVPEGKTGLEAVTKMFENWKELEPFYQDQLKPQQILSNLANIINQIKNGVTARKQKEGGAAKNSPNYTQKLKDF